MTQESDLIDPVRRRNASAACFKSPEAVIFVVNQPSFQCDFPGLVGEMRHKDDVDEHEEAGEEQMIQMMIHPSQMSGKRQINGCEVQYRMVHGRDDVSCCWQNHPPKPLAIIDAIGVLVQNALAPLTPCIAICGP
jgi:hypothetical protein